MRERDRPEREREKTKTNTPDIIYRIHIEIIQQWEYSIKNSLDRRWEQACKIINNNKA